MSVKKAQPPLVVCSAMCMKVWLGVWVELCLGRRRRYHPATVFCDQRRCRRLVVPIIYVQCIQGPGGHLLSCTFRSQLVDIREVGTDDCPHLATVFCVRWGCRRFVLCLQRTSCDCIITVKQTKLYTPSTVRDHGHWSRYVRCHVFLDVTFTSSTSYE